MSMTKKILFLLMLLLLAWGSVSPAQPRTERPGRAELRVPAGTEKR